MSRPPKITRIKPEENQPPLEAYVSDLFSPLSITENKTKRDVTPGNEAKILSANSVEVRARNKIISQMTNQKPQDELKHRRQRRSTGEPDDVSVAKKQIKNPSVTSTTKTKQCNNSMKLSLTGVKKQLTTTHDSTKQNLKLGESKVSQTLAGVTPKSTTLVPVTENQETPPTTAETTHQTTLTGVTDFITGISETPAVTKLAGGTNSLAGVTQSVETPKLENKTGMSLNPETSNENENSTLLAIARLETKLVESRKNDITEMEKRLTANMKVIVDNSIQEAIKNITSTITKAVSEDPEIARQKRNISHLQTENQRLTRKVQVLDTEYHKLKRRINIIEQKGLDHTLIIRGIMEAQDETETSIKDSVFAELAETVVGETQYEKVQIARRMEIKRCRRIGRYNRQRARPLSVEFKYKEDTKYIMENKSYLRHGIFVDYEYTVDIEQTRNLLLPILRKAQQTEPYKGHCKMEEDRLVIKGHTYTLNNLHQLPEDLNCFKVTSKQNEHCVGFFGGLNPLSNFHHAKFMIDGLEYISAEQFIQAKKAKYFKDMNAYDLIMGSTTSLDCKQNARLIKGFD